MTNARKARVIGGVVGKTAALARAAFGGDECMSASGKGMLVVDALARPLRSSSYATLTVSF